MRVLVIGSGGREHALCWKIRQSAALSALFCAPGNPGIRAHAECVSIGVSEIAKLVEFAQRESIDLTVVGPELPLSLGIVDAFCAAGLVIFGPTQAAAQLESSKAFTKEILNAVGAPTAAYEAFTDLEAALRSVKVRGAPIVVKEDGLAAGKGVTVCTTVAEAESAVRAALRSPGSKVVIEEFLAGVEASFIVATDGRAVVPLVPSHDYKRLLDGQTGPNTGGMGTVSPTSHLTPAQEEIALQRVIHPVLAEMRRRGTPFCGFLYAGLMLSPTGDLHVIEFNARLGDPETQVILRRLDSDLLLVLDALARGKGDTVAAPHWSPAAAVCVVLAASGYPEQPRKGDVIEGIGFASQIPDVLVFHAGTALNDSGALVTAGGRVLNVTARGTTLEDARRQAYRAADLIQFAGVQKRRDIGR